MSPLATFIHTLYVQTWSILLVIAPADTRMIVAVLMLVSLAIAGALVAWAGPPKVKRMPRHRKS